MEIIKVLKYLSYKKRLREETVLGILINMYKYLTGGKGVGRGCHKDCGARLFSVVSSDRTTSKGENYNTKQKKIHLNIYIFFFSIFFFFLICEGD